MLEEAMIIDGIFYKQIAGFPRYYIDYKGNVFSRFKGRHIKPSITRGYYCIRISNNSGQIQRGLAKLVAETFVPNPNPKELKYVRHKDGDASNNSFDNLEWCTKKEIHEKKCAQI